MRGEHTIKNEIAKMVESKVAMLAAAKVFVISRGKVWTLCGQQYTKKQMVSAQATSQPNADLHVIP